MSQSKKIQGLLAVAVVGGVVVQLASCSGDQFAGCAETYTCAPDGSAGSAGTSGGGTSGGGAAGSSGSGAAGSGGQAGDGEPDAGPTTGLDSPCTSTGSLSCQGPAQKLTLICSGGTWHANQTCSATQNCDQATGACADTVPECVGYTPGETFCQGDVLTQCGPDLVSSTQTPCDGLCVAANGTVACVDPACGDGKLEAGEECDDGNTTPGDDCSASCHWQVKTIAGGGGHVCALSAGGAVKCWGYAPSGELGIGDVNNRGDAPGQMGASLPAVDLGTGRHAIGVAAGAQNTCAILDDGSLKCWGDNTYGQLGQGDNVRRGDKPGTMGDSLPPIDLGAGRKVTGVFVGVTSICATLDDSSLKCWGDNGQGQLGIGDTTNRGGLPGQMGSALPAVNFNAVARFAKSVTFGSSGGSNWLCALLDDGSVHCSGSNAYGQLGMGYTSDHEAFAYGAASFGTGRTALALSFKNNLAHMYESSAFNCVLLDNLKVKCWLYTSPLAFGIDATTIAAQYGDTSATMGDGLPYLKPSPVSAIAAGEYHLCLLLGNSDVICYGTTVAAGYGALSPDPAPVLDMGTGRKATQLVAGTSFTCALLDDRSVKCWGFGPALGQGDTKTRGSAAADFGDALPVVDLSF